MNQEDTKNKYSEFIFVKLNENINKYGDGIKCCLRADVPRNPCWIVEWADTLCSVTLSWFYIETHLLVRLHVVPTDSRKKLFCQQTQPGFIFLPSKNSFVSPPQIKAVKQPSPIFSPSPKAVKQVGQPHPGALPLPSSKNARLTESDWEVTKFSFSSSTLMWRLSKLTLLSVTLWF